MGVWNGWGYGIANFRALNFKFRSLKFGKNRSFCGISGIFLENSASEKYFSDSGKWPFHTPHQSIPPLSAGRSIVSSLVQVTSLSLLKLFGSNMDRGISQKGGSRHDFMKVLRCAGASDTHSRSGSVCLGSIRALSEYCSTCVSRVGLSTK